MKNKNKITINILYFINPPVIISISLSHQSLATNMAWISLLGEPLPSNKEIQKAVKEKKVNEVADSLATISKENDKEMCCIIIKETFLHLLSSMGLAAFRLAIARNNPLINKAFEGKETSIDDHLIEKLRLIAKSTKEQILEERSIIIDPPITDAWEDIGC